MHRDENKMPIDWAHVLVSIYKVRCNLFHGGKSFLYESDKVFVELSFKILWEVWGRQQYLKK